MHEYLVANLVTRCFQTFVGDCLWILSSFASLHVADYTLEGAAISVPPCFPLCQDFDMFVTFLAPGVSPSLEVASTMAPCFTEALMPVWSSTCSTAFRTSSVASVGTHEDSRRRSSRSCLDSWRAALLPWRSFDLDFEALFHLRLRWLRQAVPACAIRWLFLQACVPWLAATLSLPGESSLLLAPSWSPPIWCRQSLVGLITEMTLVCPYQQDRLSRGLSVQCPQGLDWAETNLHRATSAAGGTQERSDTFATGAPVVHAQCAAAFSQIAGGEPQLSDDLDWALRLSTGQIEGVSLRSVRKWRTAKLRLLKRLVARGEALGLAQFFESLRSRCVSPTHAHPARMALAMASLGWSDADLPMLIASGSSLFWEMPYSGTRCVIANTTLAELLDGTEARAPLTSRASFGRRRPKRSSPSSGSSRLRGCGWGRNLLRPVVGFAVEERSGKFCVIDNGCSGGHNSCTSASERVHTCSNLASPSHCPTYGCLVCDASPQ